METINFTLRYFTFESNKVKTVLAIQISMDGNRVEMIGVWRKHKYTRVVMLWIRKNGMYTKNGICENSQFARVDIKSLFFLALGLARGKLEMNKPLSVSAKVTR